MFICTKPLETLVLLRPTTHPLFCWRLLHPLRTPLGFGQALPPMFERRSGAAAAALHGQIYAGVLSDGQSLGPMDRQGIGPSIDIQVT